MSNRIDVEIQGFAPDLGLAVSGAIPDRGGNFIPTVNGVSAPPSPINAGFPAIVDPVRGAAVVRLIDDTTRFFVGTQTALFEGTGSLTYTNQSKGGGYVGGAENRWCFVQFGNDTIATNRTDAMQVSNISGAFADLGGSPPKASIVETCQGFVLAFDYNDGVNDYPDGWWCSALRNDASWTPSIATQAANSRLLDTPGKITAAKRLGNVMVAYKQRSMYLGTYVGPPTIWDWQLIPGDVGCVSNEAILTIIIDDVPCHIFAGFDGLYIFDGSRPRFIGKPLRTWYQNKSAANLRFKIRMAHDPLKKNVKFLSSGDGWAITYNYFADRWGYEFTIPSLDGSAGGVAAAISYITGGVTYDGLGSLYSTYDALPTTIAYDSPFWTSQAETPVIIDDSGNIAILSGTPTGGFIPSSFSGDLDMFQTLIRVRPKFNLYPATENSTVQVVTQENLGVDDGVFFAEYPLVNNKYDLQISSKWFGPIFTLGEDAELTGYSLFLEEDGSE